MTPPDRRWVAGGALAAVAALFIGAIVFSDSKPASVTLPATSIRSTSTVGTADTPAEAATIPLPVAAAATDDGRLLRLVPVPPVGYRVESAYTRVNSGNNGALGSVELWGTPGTTSSTGPWFQISVTSGSLKGLIADERVKLPGGRIALRSRLPDDRQLLRFSAGGSVVSLMSERVTQSDQLTIASTLAVTNGKLSAPKGKLDTDQAPVFARFRRIGGTNQRLVFEPTYSTHYIGADGRRISVDVGQAPTQEQQLALNFFADQLVQRGSLTMRHGRLSWNSDPNATDLQYIDRGVLVTVSGPEPIDTLLDIVDSIHRAGNAEWNELSRQSRVSDPSNDPLAPLPIVIPIASNITEAAGASVTLRYQPVIPARWSLEITDPDGYVSFEPLPRFDPEQPMVFTVATAQSTSSVSIAPTEQSADARLRVSSTDRRVSVQPLVPLAIDGFSISAAAVMSTRFVTRNASLVGAVRPATSGAPFIDPT